MATATTTGSDTPPPVQVQAPSALAAVLTPLAGFLLFGALALTSITITHGEERIAAIWLPNALTIALLLRVRVPNEAHFLLACMAGNITAGLTIGDPPAIAAALALANSLEIVVALGLTRRWCGPRPVITDSPVLHRFALAVGLFAPAVSATVANTAMINIAGGPGIFAQWLVSDALSNLLLAPTALILWDAWLARRRPSRRECAEWAVLTLAGTTLTLGVFLQTSYPLLFLIPPVVIVHAFRLGPLGTAFSTLKVAIIAVACTEAGYGPLNLVDYSLTTQLMLLELFLASSLLVGLPIAATLATRNRLNAELLAERQRLALLADNITDAVLRYDRSGVCTYASPSTLRVLGLKPSDFLGLRASDRVHGDAAAEIAATERRLLSGQSTQERFTYRRYLDGEDGEPVYIEADCAAACHPVSGELEGIIVSARDVTARVALEANLKRATRHAEHAARAKAQFLANMSHEIRTPMNGVLGFADLLLRMDLPDEAERYAQLIASSGRALMVILNDILDLSKIESGELAVHPEPIELRVLLEDCRRLHQLRAEQKGIDLRIVDDPAVPEWIESDPVRLRQIVLNLIGNAVKFTEAGTIEVRVAREGDRLSLAVEDTGIGITEDRLTHIFEPFVQAEGTTTRLYGGTGLGLSISRQLAHLLSGELTVDSMPGVGSRFALSLPLAQSSPGARGTQPSTSAEVPTPQVRGRVLLAEDHDVNRMLVRAMLEELGQDVELAEDGTRAIEAVLGAADAGKAFDLVLMDVQMPGCDGYAATRAIRAAGVAASDLPIIALTANAFPEDVAAADAAGMQGHLAKPLAFEALAAVLARWLPVRIVETIHHPAHQIPAQAHGEALLDRWQARRCEALEAVALAIEAESLEGEASEELARTVHKLAGSAGMFGEAELGERAAALERALKAGVDGDVRRKLAEELLKAA